MPDYDPLLLKQLRGILGRQTTTRGAGQVDSEALFRTLNRNQPQVMGGRGMSMPGFSPARPSFSPPHRAPDNIAQGEFDPGELQSAVQPHLTQPREGGNISSFKVESLPYRYNNDAENILKQRLDNMRRFGDQDKYQMALTWQRDKKHREEMDKMGVIPQQAPMGTLSPLNPSITPQKALTTRQIYDAAKKLEASGNKEDASKLRRFNFLTEQHRDNLKNYGLAHSDLEEWVRRNAVKDPHTAMEEMDRVNKYLKSRGEAELNMLEYQQMKQFQLKRQMREEGPDNFFAKLKSDLEASHNELNRLRSLIVPENGE